MILVADMPFTEEEKYYFRYGKLLTSYGGSLLRKHIDNLCSIKKIPFSQLVENGRHDLLHIKKRWFSSGTPNANKCCASYGCDIVASLDILSEEQWTTLFKPVSLPSSHSHHNHAPKICSEAWGVKSGITTDDLDITLSSCLMTSMEEVAKTSLQHAVGSSTFENYLQSHLHTLIHSYKDSVCCKCTSAAVPKQYCKLSPIEFNSIFDRVHTMCSSSGIPCCCIYSVKKGITMTSLCSQPQQNRNLLKKIARITVYPEIDYIRDCRNALHAHKSSTSLSKSVFDYFWSESSAAILSSAKKLSSAFHDQLEKEIQDLATCSFDQKWDEEVKEWLRRDTFLLEVSTLCTSYYIYI